MAPKTPITQQVLWQLSDIRRAVVDEFTEDGVLDAGEANTIVAIDEALNIVRWWDQWRIEAVYLIDHGVVMEQAPSRHHERQRGDLRLLAPASFDESGDAA